MSVNGEMSDAYIGRTEGLDASREQDEFAYDVIVYFMPKMGKKWCGSCYLRLTGAHAAHLRCRSL
jgi:hypothetical protein